MAECGDGDSSNGRPYRTHDRLWTWQQHEEAVYRGLWQIRGLAAAMGGPVIWPAPYVKKRTTPAVCEETWASGTWQSVAMETAAMGVPTWAPWPRLTFWP
ncbi:unnamed protein product, partial [Staurois parvus]